MTATRPTTHGPSSSGVKVPGTQIGELVLRHWPEVAEIFRQGLATGLATFETEVPSWECWDASHMNDHRFVALSDGKVIGWTAANAVVDHCIPSWLSTGPCSYGVAGEILAKVT